MNWKSDFKQWLLSQNKDHFEFTENHDLSKSSTLRLKSQCDFLKIKNVSFLVKLFNKFNGKRFRVIGRGANIVLPEDNHDHIFIRLGLDSNSSELEESRDSYYLSASTSLSKVISHAMNFGKKNWEVLTGIPGTLGGAITMNAGTKLGEISEIVSQLQIVKSNGDLIDYVIKPDDFSYRKNHFLEEGDVVISVTLKSFGDDEQITQVMKEYMSYREKTQPLWEKTCGSVFKNDSSYLAGKSIDLAGLKGLSSGGLGVSDLHANFIINQNSGNRSDFVRLTNALKQELERTYGVSFELEAKFL